MSTASEKVTVVDAIEPGAPLPTGSASAAGGRSPRSIDSVKQALGWAVGIPFASARYMARDVEIERETSDCPWPLAGFADAGEGRPGGRESVRSAREGVGPAYRRRYEVCVDEPLLSAVELMAVMQNDPSVACPLEIAHFEKTRGRPGRLEPGDEFRVRLPGPWNGPVRVVEVTERSFRLATLEGHMEAGEIEFRAHRSDNRLRFEIESWARSGSRAFHLLYDRLGVSRELQLHMWAHFLERVAQISGGTVSGAIKLSTERCDRHPL